MSVYLSVRPLKSRLRRASNFANRLLLAIARSVLKMGYIGSQDLVHPKPIHWGLGTWKVRFGPNLILRLVYQLLITLPKSMLIGPQAPVHPI